MRREVKEKKTVIAWYNLRNRMKGKYIGVESVRTTDYPFSWSQQEGITVEGTKSATVVSHFIIYSVHSYQ